MWRYEVDCSRYNKERRIERARLLDCGTVRLAGTAFSVGVFGGYISNCSDNFSGDEDDILFSLDNEFLDKKLIELQRYKKDIEYLENLIKNRKDEILDTESEYTLDTMEYQNSNNNKKYIDLIVNKKTTKKDIYDDELVDIEDIETRSIPNIKANRELIEETIAELKEKYAIK